MHTEMYVPTYTHHRRRGERRGSIRTHTVVENINWKQNIAPKEREKNMKRKKDNCFGRDRGKVLGNR